MADIWSPSLAGGNVNDSHFWVGTYQLLSFVLSQPGEVSFVSSLAAQLNTWRTWSANLGMLSPGSSFLCGRQSHKIYQGQPPNADAVPQVSKTARLSWGFLFQGCWPGGSPRQAGPMLGYFLFFLNEPQSHAVCCLIGEMVTEFIQVTGSWNPPVAPTWSEVSLAQF